MKPTAEIWRQARMALGYGIAAAAIYFTVRRLNLSPSEIWHSISALNGWRAFLVMMVFLAHGAINAVAFGILLKSFGARTSILAGASSWAASVLAKYIPGGVWQIVGRGVMLHRQGVSPKVMFWSSILEQLISVGGCIAFVLLASRISGVGVYREAWWVGIAILAAVFSLPWWAPASAGIMQSRAYVAAAGFYVLALVPYGVAYILLVSPDDLSGFIQGLFEGTVAGILALFAPGGIGVRESWVAMAQAGVEGGKIFGVLILARLLIMASEVALTLLAMAYQKVHALRRLRAP